MIVIKRCGLMTRKHVHNYTKEFGGTQKELVFLYLSRGKGIDEIQDILKCPRASLRRLKQEWYDER